MDFPAAWHVTRLGGSACGELRIGVCRGVHSELKRSHQTKETSVHSVRQRLPGIVIPGTNGSVKSLSMTSLARRFVLSDFILWLIFALTFASESDSYMPHRPYFEEVFPTYFFFGM